MCKMRNVSSNNFIVKLLIFLKINISMVWICADIIFMIVVYIPVGELLHVHASTSGLEIVVDTLAIY